MAAALLDPRRSLPRIIMARLSVRAVCWLMLVGDRLAPEVAKG
jgi:hypothetical protein